MLSDELEEHVIQKRIRASSFIEECVSPTVRVREKIVKIELEKNFVMKKNCWCFRKACLLQCGPRARNQGLNKAKY